MFRHLGLLALISTSGLAPSAASDRDPVPAEYTRNVAIVLYDGVELLDFAGPGEVFAAAAGQGADGPRRAFRVYTVATTKAPLRAQGFVTITPEFAIDEAPKPDIVVVPGGSAEALYNDPRFIEWLRRGNEQRITLTVCTGALVAAKAGLLDGAVVTTHYGSIDALRAALPSGRVQEGLRFADNGRVITTAGVSAGIDGALHLVARLLGRDVADRTAQYMEYSWSPPATHAQSYTLLNPSLDGRGRQRQNAAIRGRDGDLDSAVQILTELVTQEATDGRAWTELGRTQAMAGRHEAAVAAYQTALRVGAPESRGTTQYNLGCSLAMLGRKDDALTALERAVEAGFRVRWMFVNDSDLQSLRNEARYQKLLESLANTRP